MKKLFVMIAISAGTFQAQALIADRFRCELEIKELGTKESAKIMQDFSVARLPLSQSPTSDVRLTAGEAPMNVKLETARATYGADLNFYFKHAIRLDSSGKAIEARQFTCLGLAESYCEKADEYRLCSEGRVACVDSNEPFDPIYGWSPSALIAGVPVFNEQQLTPITRAIKDDNGRDRGMIRLNCRFLGTYQ